MKKVISIILTLCIVFGMFSLCAAAEEVPMKVIVTSDIHWRNVGSVSSDGFFRPRDSLGQMTSLTPLIVERFFADAAASDADYVFISGDLTDSGSPADSRIFAGMLADFEAESGKQVYVIDGNHDVDMMDNVPDYSSDHVLFRETYRQFGYDEALAVDEATSSYTADLKNGYRLLAVNSNKWNGHGGGAISDELLAWIETQVNAAKKDGKKIVAMMHHHIMDHFPMEQKIDDFYILDNYQEICRKFDEWNIRVTFTGHLHVSDIAKYEGVNTVYDVTTASLACYPLTYRAVTFTDRAVKIESRAIESLDVANIVPGYSDEQKEMIANDPAGYGYGCLGDSLIEDYVKNFVSAEKLIDTLGLEADSLAAKAIKKILPEVLVPLYGEGETVESMAKALGYTLPASDYETVGDLITAFFAAFVRGDEDCGGNSKEGKLFLDAAYALFATKLANESPAVKAVLSSKVASLLGLKGINNIFTRSALDKILTGIFVDKAPGDNDVTLRGYERSGSHLWQCIARFLRQIFEFFRGFFALDGAKKG